MGWLNRNSSGCPRSFADHCSCHFGFVLAVQAFRRVDGSLGSESQIPSIVFLAVNVLPLVGLSCSLGKTGTASLLCEKG